jgi:hypothetical protein
MARRSLAALLACGAVQKVCAYAPLPPHKPPHPPHPFNPPIAFATAIRCAAAQDSACKPLGGALTRALARSGEGGPPIRDTPVGEAGTTTFTINWLTDIDPLAQCNDVRSRYVAACCACADQRYIHSAIRQGSPAAYYYAPGYGSAADLWVVYLEGSVRAQTRA